MLKSVALAVQKLKDEVLDKKSAKEAARVKKGGDVKRYNQQRKYPKNGGKKWKNLTWFFTPY